MSHFFGLGLNYKTGMHEEIFSLCYYGQGGFTWDEVYGLPIHLRRFYIKKVQEEIEKKNKAEQDAHNSSKGQSKVPNFTKPTK